MYHPLFIIGFIFVMLFVTLIILVIILSRTPKEKIPLITEFVRTFFSSILPSINLIGKIFGKRME